MQIRHFLILARLSFNAPILYHKQQACSGRFNALRELSHHIRQFPMMLSMKPQMASANLGAASATQMNRPRHADP
jgi:hypothetical protein